MEDYVFVRGKFEKTKSEAVDWRRKTIQRPNHEGQYDKQWST